MKITTSRPSRDIQKVHGQLRKLCKNLSQIQKVKERMGIDLSVRVLV